MCASFSESHPSGTDGEEEVKGEKLFSIRVETEHLRLQLFIDMHIYI